MNLPLPLSSRVETERVIAAARVALAAAIFFAIWSDPVEPARYIPAAYWLQGAYFAYALGLAVLAWMRPTSTWMPLTTHVTDLVLASVMQYVTLGPSSPLFLYFIFCLFCGALRWRWRGTLATGVAVLAAYLAMGAIGRAFAPADFEVARFITRSVYLIVAAGLLAHLGVHRASLSSRTETERVIAVARIALASASLFGTWMESAGPAQYASITYSLHSFYIFYSMGLAAFVWTRTLAAEGRLPLVTHAADIVFVSVMQYFTLGPSSPFFLYFIFCLLCGALRWGWQGSLATAGVVLVVYVGMGASMSRTLGPSEFELDRFVIRSVYLIATAGFLVYLGRSETRLRGKIERLAGWPAASGSDTARGIERVLEYAAGVVGAGGAMAIWDVGEEPDVRVARWPADGAPISKHPPGALNPPVPPALAGASFFSAGRVSADSDLLVDRGKGDLVATTDRLHPEVIPWLTGIGLASAPFKTELVSGRVFFTDLSSPVAELVPLTEVVAREIGTSLTHLSLNEQMKEIAASEERIRVARDLHDGVLQSLTGVRLELRAIAAEIQTEPTARDRLFAVERALAIEQRELRFFIDGLSPGVPLRGDGTLAGRLDEMRERIALEWKMPVTIRLAPTDGALPERIERAVPLMIHEAVVNALKHGQPSRVAVTVDGGPDQLRIVVADDGQGFPFRGRYTHSALTETNTGPRSLLDRVTALGGQMSIESTDAGSRVEMVLSF